MGDKFNKKVECKKPISKSSKVGRDTYPANIKQENCIIKSTLIDSESLENYFERVVRNKFSCYSESINAN